jgi:hypothetical protein
MAKNNIIGSEDWNKIVETQLDSYDNIISNIKSDIASLSPDNYMQKKTLLNQAIEAQGKKMATIRATNRHKAE